MRRARHASCKGNRRQRHAVRLVRRLLPDLGLPELELLRTPEDRVALHGHRAERGRRVDAGPGVDAVDLAQDGVLGHGEDAERRLVHGSRGDGVSE